MLSSGHGGGYGLWDLLAGINTAISHRSCARLVRLGQALTSDLLQRGLFEVVCGGVPDSDGLQLVAAADHATVLPELTSWVPYSRAEANDPYYPVISTPAVLEAHYGARVEQPEQAPPVV